MKSKTGVVFMAIGAVLITAALSLAFYNIHTDRNAGDYAEKTLEEIESQMPELENPSETPEINGNQLIESELMDSAEIDGHSYVGIIHIPSLDIKLPVMSKWNYENLKLSPCLYSGSLKENSMIIAAHNYSSHFGKIKELKSDDEVYFIDMKGYVYAYKVCETDILDGTDTEEMKSGNWPLTLFTCNFSGTQRVTVRCDNMNN